MFALETFTLAEFKTHLLAEFVGTMVLILLNSGAVYSILMKKLSYVDRGKFLAINIAVGFAVMFGVISGTALGGDAHLNPAVTLMKVFAFHKEWNVAKFFTYLLAQILGTAAAQIILNFINWKHWQSKENTYAELLACHSTNAVFGNKKDRAVVFNSAYEVVGTTILLGMILALARHPNANISSILPVLIGFVVASIGLSVGSQTGYALNPTRDAVPRVIFGLTLMIFKKKSFKEAIALSNWGYGWLPIVVPSLTGIAVGLIALGVTG